MENPALRIVVIDPSRSDRARRVAAATGAQLCEKAPGQRPEVIHVFGAIGDVPVAVGRWWWRRVPVVWTPSTGPAPLPWWHRRVARLVVATQAEARAWSGQLALARVCACEDPASVEAVYREVASMSGRFRRASVPT